MDKKLLYLVFFSILMVLPMDFLYAQHEGMNFYASAENLRRKKQYEPALKQFKEAILREPSNHRYFFGQAQCEFRLRKNNDALKSLYLLIRIKKNFAPAYALMAKIYLSKKDIKKAAQLYDMAFRYEKNPKQKLKYKLFVIKNYIKNEKYEVALHKIAEAKIVDSKNIELRFYDAQVSNILGKHQSAKASVLSIESIISNLHYSENSRFYYELGYAHYHLEEYKEAFAAWKKAYYGKYKIKIEIFSPGFFNKLAFAYFEIYDFDKAAFYIAQVAKIDAEHLESQGLTLKIKKEMAIDEELLVFQKKAAEQSNDVLKKSNYYKEMCKKYLATSQYPQALEAVTKALEVRAKDMEALFLQALIYYKEDKFAEAVSTLDLIIPHTKSDNLRSKLHFLKGLAQKDKKEYGAASKTFPLVKTQPYRSGALQEMRNLPKE